MVEEGFKRKLTAILSADVVGYSRMMEDNEEATIQTLNTYRRSMGTLIQQLRGRVVDTTGDNLMAEFTSAVDAVNCAVEIQRELAERNAELPYNRKMEFRIGVNVGDVVEEDDRIYGDGVNIAARVEAMADAGGICISGRAYDQVANKLGLEYENIGEHRVKNISTPIRIYRVLSYPGAAAHRVVKAKADLGRRWRKIVLAIGVASILCAGLVLIWDFFLRPASPPVKVASEVPGLPLPDKPSIAILPFENLNQDPKEDYFSDGMTDTLITDLSKISGLFVIARNSVFTYKGKPVKVKQIGKELGVRYILEGSVQKADNHVRINAQLIDTTTGGHLWADRYDAKMENLFALQDKITYKIVSALAVKLTDSEEKQVAHRGTDNIEAYDAYLKGQGHYFRWTRDDFNEAIHYLNKAIDLDPNYGWAYAMLGWVHWHAPGGWLNMGWDKARMLARQYLEMAMENPGPFAYLLAARMKLRLRLHKEAILEVERCRALAPNDPSGHAIMAEVLNYAGRPKEAIEHIKIEMRLDPDRIHFSLCRLGIAHFSMRKYEQAATYFERGLKHNPDFKWPLIYLAATYAHLGRIQEAKEIFDKYSLASGWYPTLSELMVFMPFKDLEVSDRLADGLLKAGLSGQPSGYHKILEENRLSGEETRKLLFGRTTIDEFGSNYIEYKINGEIIITGPKSYRLVHDTGTALIDDDIMCHQFQWKRFGDLKNCFCIYRNPEGTPEDMNEYLMVSYTGINLFSLID